VSGQLHAPVDLTPGEKAAGTHFIGGWVDPKAGLDDVGKILDHTGTRIHTLRSSSPSPVAISALLFQCIVSILRVVVKETTYD
jgi:hypothetical protein